MSSLGPGTTLVARYRLAEPVETDLVGVESWSAQDTVLDRPVQVSVVRGPAAPDALDASRRAALVSDPRLARVLDVGAQEGVSYVVTERYRGTTLTSVVDQGLVTPEQARSIVGEVASAIEVARRRGVHHLALRPDAVRLDGTEVLVTGLGLDAGIAGIDATDSDATSRADAVALVALLYYLLSARWGGQSLDLPVYRRDRPRPLDAVRTDGVPAALPAGTPADIASLCATTLAAGSTEGPRTPGDVVASLEPWSRVEVPVPAPAPAAPVRAPVRQSIRTSAGAAAVPPSAGRIHRPDGAGAALGAAAAAGAGAAAVAASGAAAVPGATAPDGGWSTAPIPPIPPAPRTTTPPAYAPSGVWGAAAPTTPQAPAAQPYTTQPVATAPAGPAATAPIRTSATAPRPAAAAAGTAAAGAGAGAAGAGGSDDGGKGAGPGRRGTFDPTWITLAVVALVVVLGVVWASATVFGGVDPSSPTAAGPVAETANADEPSAAPTEAAEEPTPTPTPEVRPEIASGEAIDPEGAAAGDTTGEHPEAADRAIDGQPETFWYTRYYGTPQFGGLKSGVGYVITLAQKAPVSTIILDTNNTGGKVEVRQTTASKPTDGKVLASSELSDETELTFDPVEGKTFVLWFTELPTAPDGTFHIELNEILVS